MRTDRKRRAQPTVSRPRPPTVSLEAQMLAVARTGSPPAGHLADDDCPLCRMLAESGQAPSEIITLPDGSTLEVYGPLDPEPGSFS